MPLILQRKQVLQVYTEVEDRKWVLPAFNAENLTTIEAVLAAADDYGHNIGVNDLPIIIGITNNYLPRPQSVYYTHTRQWNIGLKLFLEDLKVLTSPQSPFARLKVMIHLDHIQWDEDQELLNWDMNQFSSIMYDASPLPFEQNIQKTKAFIEKYGDIILVEGACNDICQSNSDANNTLTKPNMAEKYLRETGADIIVANLGTEHRATTADLHYDSELAREITKRTGPCLCLHGTSSVSVDQLDQLFNDGIRKANIWTALERDSSATLFQDMLENAAKIIDSKKIKKLLTEKLLGNNADCNNRPSIDYYTTTYRQNKIFNNMKKIVMDYLRIFYNV